MMAGAGLMLQWLFLKKGIARLQKAYP